MAGGCGGVCGESVGRASAGSDVSAGCEGYGVSTTGVEGTAGDSARRDSELFGDCAAVGCAKVLAGGRRGDWGESGGGGGGVSSRGGKGWLADRVSMGRGKEEEATGGGEGLEVTAGSASATGSASEA